MHIEVHVVEPNLLERSISFQHLEYRRLYPG